MKKFIVCFFVLVFVTTIVSVAFGRTFEEEKQAVRNYLNVVDAKLATAKQAKDKARVDLLHKEKAATLLRWEKLKNTMVVAPTPVPVQPIVVVVTPSVEVKPVETMPVGLFGLGLNSSLSGQYIYSGHGALQGGLGLKWDVVSDDFIGMGKTLGLPKDTFLYKFGLGAYYGGSMIKAIPVYAGGIINLGQSWMGESEVYLTGGLNYVVYGNGQTSGKIGGDAYIGVKVDLGLGLGKTGIELGYSVVRSNTETLRGPAFSISQTIVL